MEGQPAIRVSLHQVDCFFSRRFGFQRDREKEIGGRKAELKELCEDFNNDIANSLVWFVTLNYGVHKMRIVNFLQDASIF